MKFRVKDKQGNAVVVGEDLKSQLIATGKRSESDFEPIGGQINAQGGDLKAGDMPDPLEGMSQGYRDKVAQLRMQRPQAQADQMAENYPLLSAIAPRGVANEGEGVVGDVGASLGDTFSMVGRLIASVKDFEGETMQEKMQNYLQSVRETQGEGVVQQILRHPATGAALAMAPFIAPMAAGGTAIGAGAIEGLGVAGVSQMSRLGEGRNLSPGEALADVALSMALPGFGIAFKKFAKPVKEAFLNSAKYLKNDALASFISQLSGANTEALKVASTAKGRKDLIRHADTFQEIAQNILSKIDNIDHYYANEKALKVALDAMPNMNPKQVVDELINIKNKMGNSTKALAAKARIIKEIQGLQKDYGTFEDIVNVTHDAFGTPKKNVTKKFKYKDLTADEFRRLRIDLDDMVDYGKEYGSDKFNDAVKATANKARKMLIDASDGTAYEQTMKDYAKVLDARETFYKAMALGKPSKEKGVTTMAADMRLGKVLSNIFNRGNEPRIKYLKMLDDIFGENFTKETKLATLAKSIVKDNEIPLFPTQWTGRSTLGPMLGKTAASIPGIGKVLEAPFLAASSPALGSRMLQAGNAIGKATGMGTGLEWAGKGLGNAVGGGMGLAGDIMNNPYLQRTVPGLARIPLRGE